MQRKEGMKKKEIGQCRDCEWYEVLLTASGAKQRCLRPGLPYQFLPNIIKGCWYWKEMEEEE